jgi:hypothetical protein
MENGLMFAWRMARKDGLIINLSNNEKIVMELI